MKHSHSFIKHIRKVSNDTLTKKLCHHLKCIQDLTTGVNPEDMPMQLIRKVVRHMNRADLIELELKHRGLS